MRSHSDPNMSETVTLNKQHIWKEHSFKVKKLGYDVLQKLHTLYLCVLIVLNRMNLLLRLMLMLLMMAEVM